MRWTDRTDGQLHVPDYRLGCWGRPGAPVCWVCRFRHLWILLKLHWRYRRA